MIDIAHSPHPLLVDVCVVGGGPAGLAAATGAAEAGADVLLLDDCPRLGGQIWRHQSRATLHQTARSWLSRLDRTTRRVVTGISISDMWAARDDGVITLCGAHGAKPFVAGARAVVLATGARELFIPFPGWILPNVLGVGGVQALVKSGMLVAGKRAVVAGSGPLLLPVAAMLARQGADVRLVAEQAPPGRVRRFACGLWRSPGKLIEAAFYRAAFARVPYLMGTWVVEAHGVKRVEWVTLTDGTRTWTKPCDLLCVGYGLVPNIELAALAGCEVIDGTVLVDERQQTTLPGIYCAGEPTGVGGMDLAMVEGEIAGLAAAGKRYLPAALRERRARLQRFAERTSEAFALRDELGKLVRPDTIVCRCEDVRAGELDPAWSPRQAKLYTRAGMGPCQGRVCGAALTALYGWSSDSIRPPAVAVPIGALLEARDSIPTR